MKNLLIITMLLCSTQVFAQSYSEVIQVEGKTANDLYTSAREWFAITFNSANDVLQMDDLSSGKLIGKGSTSVSEYFTAGKGLTALPITMNWSPNFTIKIEVRAGRYKCDITDVVIKSYSEFIGTTEIPFSDYLNQLDTYKKGSDPEWLKSNPPNGKKVGKSMARTLAQTNQATYKLILKVEEQLQTLMDGLEVAMKKESENNW